jgi:hypothetical protein
VLPPETEHGELGREDPLLRHPCWRGDVPEQLLPGVGVGRIASVSKIGEFLRTEQSWSWADSSPSTMSKTYFTAGTSSSVLGSGGGGGGGGNTGTGGSSRPPMR